MIVNKNLNNVICKT